MTANQSPANLSKTERQHSRLPSVSGALLTFSSRSFARESTYAKSHNPTGHSWCIMKMFLVISCRITAKQIGLEIPQSVLYRADKVTR
jgi:hypothetical protein